MRGGGGWDLGRGGWGVLKDIFLLVWVLGGFGVERVYYG